MTKKPSKPNLTPEDRKEILKAEEKRAQELAAARGLLPAHPEAEDDTTPEGAKKVARDKFGRPTVMTATVILKLEQAAAIGCPLRECAIYAGIGYTTLMEYLKRNEDFRNRLEDLKETPILAARANVIRDITNHKNVSTSLEYLRRKRRDEFADKSVVGVEKEVSADELEKLANGEVEIEDPDAEKGDGKP